MKNKNIHNDNFVTLDGEVFRSDAHNWVGVPCKSRKGTYIRQKVSHWRNRLFCEKMANNCWFVTLTYNDDNIETEPNHKHVSDFIKRLRRYISYYYPYKNKSQHTFRYFCVPEFGDKKGRLHYHLLLYNCPKDLVAYMTRPWSDNRSFKEYIKGGNRQSSKHNNIWNKGFVNAELAKDSKIGYVTKYLFKHVNGHWLKSYKSRCIGNNLVTNDKLKQFRSALRKTDGNVIKYGKRWVTIPKCVLKHIDTRKVFNGRITPAFRDWQFDRLIKFYDSFESKFCVENPHVKTWLTRDDGFVQYAHPLDYLNNEYNIITELNCHGK